MDETWEGWTLHRAAAVGHVEKIRTRLAVGDDVNVREGNNWTPLHTAAAVGTGKAVRVLLAAGACVNARSSNNGTPLHMAAALECKRDGNGAAGSGRGREREGCGGPHSATQGGSLRGFGGRRCAAGGGCGRECGGRPREASRNGGARSKTSHDRGDVKSGSPAGSAARAGLGRRRKSCRSQAVGWRLSQTATLTASPAVKARWNVSRRWSDRRDRG